MTVPSLDSLLDPKISLEDKLAVVNSTKTLRVRELANDLLRTISGETPDEIILLSISELRGRPRPNWIVEGLIQESTVVTFAGEAGIGKSFTALHIAACVAAGLPFFDRSVKRGRVLYVVAEGAASFGNRIDAWESYHGRTIPDDAIAFVESGVDLAAPDSVRRLIARLKEFKPDLIILDTLSQLASIDNENDAAQVARVYRTARKLRETVPGSSVILVHHVNKASGGVRGSSVIRSNSDTVIVAKKTGATFDISTEGSHDGKQKDGKAETLSGFQLTEHGPSAVVTQSSSTASDPIWNAVHAILKDGEWHDAAEIKNAAGIGGTGTAEYKRYTIRMAKWVDDGLIAVEGNQRTRRYKITSILARP